MELPNDIWTEIPVGHLRLIIAFRSSSTEGQNADITISKWHDKLQVREIEDYEVWLNQLADDLSEFVANWRVKE